MNLISYCVEFSRRKATCIRGVEAACPEDESDVLIFPNLHQDPDSTVFSVSCLAYCKTPLNRNTRADKDTEKCLCWAVIQQDEPCWSSSLNG